MAPKRPIRGGHIVPVNIWDEDGNSFNTGNPVPTTGDISVAAGTILSVSDPLLEISRGNVTGQTPVNKFGHSHSGIQTTFTDVWERADAAVTQQIWIAPTTARIHAIVSTDNEDSDIGGVNPQGDGLRTLRIFGLPDWNTAEISEDIIMDGTNAVNSINSYVIIYRMKTLTKGNNVGGIPVGTITATAAVDGTITAQINPGEGQTQMAIYGIPSTQTLYLIQWYGNILKAQGQPATITYTINVNPTPQTELINFLIKQTRGVQSTGSSDKTWKWEPYFSIPGPAIIKAQGEGSASDLEGSAGFDGILVDN